MSTVVGVGAAGAAPGDPILVFSGNTSLSPGTTYASVGSVSGRSISSTTVMPGSLSGNACVLLNLNQATFTGPQVVTLTNYLAGGGKVIMVGENDNYANNQSFRDLATALGSSMQIQNNAFDPGFRPTMNIDADPLTRDVDDIEYAYTATVTLSGTARSLVRRDSGTGTFIAAQSIGSGELIALGDANAFTAPNGDAGVLVANTCGNRRTTSAATACLPASALVGTTVTCTSTVTDSDSGTAVTPTGDVGFTRTGTGAGTFGTGDICTLTGSGTLGTASCSISYVASAPGAQTLTGAYKGTFNSFSSSASDAHSATLPTPPTATGGQSTAAAGQPQTFTVSVPAGATMSLLDGGVAATSVTVAGEGVYTLASDTITLAPAAGFSGTARPVAFRITDAYGQSSDAAFAATVLAPAPPTTDTDTETTPTPPVTSTPVTTVCTSRRVLSLNFRAPKGTKLRGVTFKLNGKVQRKLAGDARKLTVDLRGYLPGAVRVTMEAKTTSGRTVRNERVYKTCAPRARSPRRRRSTCCRSRYGAAKLTRPRPFGFAALALVHRGHAGDRDLPAFLDEIVGQGLRLRHGLCPWVARAQQRGRRLDREGGGIDALELVPADRERDRRARPDAWAVGSDDGGAVMRGRPAAVAASCGRDLSVGSRGRRASSRSRWRWRRWALDAKPRDAYPVHVLDRQSHRADGHLVTRLRAVAESVEDEAGHAARAVLGQLRADGFVEVIDRHRSRNLERALIDVGESVVG